MLMKIKAKRAMSVSIVLLVLATLVLSSFALFTFYQREKSVQEKIYVARFLEDIYTKEDIINFYLDNIMENAAAKSKDKNEFIDNFKEELSKYKYVPELEQIENQINEDTMGYDEDNKIITAEFQIKIEDKKEIFSAVYVYNKKFEKTLLV